MRWIAAIFASSLVVAPAACKGPKGQSKDKAGAESAGKITDSEGVPTEAPPSDKPTFRLDDRAAPTGYEVHLAINPSSETFTGKITIAMDVSRETDVIWMHGRELDIKSAVLTVGERVLEGKAETGENHLLGFRFAGKVPVGKASLDVSYSGRIVRRDGAGIFAEKEGEDWYQYTQFESLDARRAFPCFDEPRWKTPWKVTLEVAKDLVAVANTPVDKEEVIGETKVVSFLETKPLPSYLVAFAVGPFEMVPAGKTRAGMPMRIITPRGRASEAAYAAKVTKEIVAELEKYFGRPYPYEKLDTLIIPTTQGFGAMENAGLITFASRIALWKDSQDSFDRQRRFALVQVHEVGHHWFGDLVTMPWWDDIWLNEAFASWIENRVLASWRPAWKLEAVSMSNKEQAMAADALASARQIREPVDDENGVESAFDRITYEKGESVINMFESYVGPAAWQKGVRAHLAKYAWKTATAREFLASMDAASGKDVSTPFNTFLEQNGTPLVKMALECEEGKAPRLRLEQSRYLPAGSKAAAARTWQIPICVGYQRGQRGQSSAEACTLLAEREGEIELGASGCPSWVNPNARGVGYYRSDIGAKMRASLVELSPKTLSLSERLTLIGDLEALVESGAAPIDEALSLLPVIAVDGEPIINRAAVGLAHAVSTMILADDLPAYRARVRTWFQPLAARIGWSPKRRESEHTGALRPKLLRLLGGLGEDPGAIAMAQEAAKDWLDGKGVLAPELVGDVLSIAARNGDEALFERLSTRAIASDNRIDRRDLLEALGHFRAPLTAKALALTVSDKLDARDALAIIEAAARWRDTRAKAVQFVLKNYATLAKSLSEPQLAGLPSDLDSICEPKTRKLVAAFFAERSAKLPGGALALKQAVELIDLCVAARAAQGKRASEILSPAK